MILSLPTVFKLLLQCLFFPPNKNAHGLIKPAYNLLFAHVRAVSVLTTWTLIRQYA